MSPNPGYLAGIKQHSPIERLSWQLKASPTRRKDKRLGVMEAMAEARMLVYDLALKCAKRGIFGLCDASVELVFAHKGDLGKSAGRATFRYGDPSVPPITMSLTNPREADLDRYLSWDRAILRDHADHVPIGFVITLVERHGEKQRRFAHDRPLLLSPEARRLLKRESEIF